MSIYATAECDQCHTVKKVPVLSWTDKDTGAFVSHEWLSLQSRSLSDGMVFCSYTCLSAWAAAQGKPVEAPYRNPQLESLLERNTAFRDYVRQELDRWLAEATDGR